MSLWLLLSIHVDQIQDTLPIVLLAVSTLRLYKGFGASFGADAINIQSIETIFWLHTDFDAPHTLFNLS